MTTRKKDLNGEAPESGERDLETTSEFGSERAADAASGEGDDGSKRAEGAKAAAEGFDRLLHVASCVPLWAWTIVVVAAVAAVGPWFGATEGGFPAAVLDVWLLVWLARMLLLATFVVAIVVAYFVIRSIFTRTLRQEWGWKAPWLETETKTIADLEAAVEENEKLQRALERAEQKNVDLSARLGEATAEIKSKDRELDRLRHPAPRASSKKELHARERKSER